MVGLLLWIFIGNKNFHGLCLTLCCRKVPLAAESLHSGTSSAASQQTHPPSGHSPLTTPAPSSNSYTATFPRSAGVFSIRDAPQSQTQSSVLGKAGNGTHKSSRPSKVSEDSLVGSKRRRNSSFYSLSSSFPAVDNHKRNGNGHHLLQSLGSTVATPARKKELGGGGSGLWSGGDGWLSRGDSSQSFNSQNRLVWGATLVCCQKVAVCLNILVDLLTVCIVLILRDIFHKNITPLNKKASLIKYCDMEMGIKPLLEHIYTQSNCLQELTVSNECIVWYWRKSFGISKSIYHKHITLLNQKVSSVQYCDVGISIYACYSLYTILYKNWISCENEDKKINLILLVGFYSRYKTTPAVHRSSIRWRKNKTFMGIKTKLRENHRRRIQDGQDIWSLLINEDEYKFI